MMHNGKDDEVLGLQDISVGQRFATDRLRVDLEGIRNFAVQFGPQPMHLDEEAARGSVFGELVGSGWHSVVLTMRLVVEARILGATPHVGVQLREIDFLWPLRPGDTLWAQVDVLEVRASRSDPARGLVTMEITTYTGSGPLVRLTWTLLVPKC
jgi:acyl dehydratase